MSAVPLGHVNEKPALFILIRMQRNSLPDDASTSIEKALLYAQEQLKEAAAQYNSSRQGGPIAIYFEADFKLVQENFRLAPDLPKKITSLPFLILAYPHGKEEEINLEAAVTQICKLKKGTSI
jgi:hypothetical protein